MEEWGNFYAPFFATRAEAETIVLLTECLTLEAGDVIVMGTPAGVGYARKPPVWMKQGDTIEVEIEGIGVLSNPIRDEVP